VAPYDRGPNGAVGGEVDPEDVDRRAIQRLLTRPEVGTLALSAGLDLKRARGAVAGLTGGVLADVAASARSAESALETAESTVLTYSLKIILLLILVVLIVD
jgi:hypothetical protein